MDIIDAIFTRRSVRSFTTQTIADDDLQTVLRAAMQAPSARNYQPWHFVVTARRDILDKIPDVHPYGEMMREATAAILVCGDLKLEKMVDYIVEDCSAATQNILLAAHGLGLGAVWLGVYPREKRMIDLKKLFNVPDDIVPVSLIALGYPKEQPSKIDRFKKERIHWDRWL